MLISSTYLIVLARPSGGGFVPGMSLCIGRKTAPGLDLQREFLDRGVSMFLRGTGKYGTKGTEYNVCPVLVAEVMSSVMLNFCLRGDLQDIHCLVAVIVQCAS